MRAYLYGSVVVAVVTLLLSSAAFFFSQFLFEKAKYYY